MLDGGTILKLKAENNCSFSFSVSSGPLLVHCKDGCSKSGLFLAAYKTLQDCEDPAVPVLDIYQTLMAMTKKGMRVLRTREQYKFLHQCLYDDLTEEEDGHYANDYS